MFRQNYQVEAVYVTAALARFKDSIPEQAFRISFCCDSLKEFYIAKYSNDYITNNKSLVIDSISKTDTIMFSDYFKEELIEFSYPPHVFSELTHWGSIKNTKEKPNYIQFDKCELRPIDGFNKIYYKILK